MDTAVYSFLAICSVGGVLCGFAQGVPTFHPKPAWNVAEAPCRLVVEKKRDDFFLIRLPASVEGKPVAAVRAFVVTNEIAARAVWADTGTVTVILDAREAHRGQAVKVYPVPGEKALVSEGTGARIDPEPLRGCARRTAGMDFPSGLADVRMLETRCDTKPHVFTVSDFGKLDTTFKNWFQGDWTRKNHLVDLQTWLLVPTDGKYLFGLAGVAPAWLLLDGTQVLAHPAGRPYDAWTTGAEVPIRAGLHCAQVRTVCRQEIDTGVAWKRVGEPGVASNVVMITGGDLREGRWEWRNRRVQPFAEPTVGHAYRFAGVNDVFVPFEVKDASSCWGTNHVTRWELGGQKVGEGESWAATLRASALPSHVGVRVRAATGEEAVYEAPLVYDGLVWAEHEISSRVTGLPAACYADDRVQPIIRIRTSAEDGLAYELVSDIRRADGSRTNRVDALTTDHGWARVYLNEFEAGSVSCVSWSLRHIGAEISSGCVDFLREPFRALPDSVSGESLKIGSHFAVFVADKASREGRTTVAHNGSETNAVVFFDGFVCGGSGDAGGWLAKKGWRRVDLPVIEQTEDASGMSVLLPFVAVSNTLPFSTVVLAPSFLSVSREGGTAGFERRLAALTGLLSGPACGSPRVLLVVPPAFDVLPGCGCVPCDKPCPHAAAARDYAETVMRVADAHGVETVDLFTAFSIAGRSPALVSHGFLTPAGIALAENLIEKKVAEAP